MRLFVAKLTILLMGLLVVAPSFAANDSADDAALVEAALLSQLRMGFRSLCSDCRIEFKDMKIPKFAKEDLTDLRINFAGLRWNGSFVLPIEFMGQPQAFISGQVRFFKQGLVTKQAVAVNAEVNSELASTDWVDVTFQKDRLASEKDIRNVIAAKPLQIRQPILVSDLKKPEVVKRGQSVKIIYGNDSFEVSTQMRAEEAGAEGDLIKVKSLDSAKTLSARVLEDGAARID